MLQLKDILERGYFPKELPPLFSTRSIARHFKNLPLTAKDTSYCLRYSYSKYATVRRTLSIPNPAHFLPLAAEVAKSWTVLETHCATSKISKTQPTTMGDRAINWATSLDDIPSIRAQHRVGGRYILQADVAACYATMYTHAIPWALHTKTVAKGDRSHKKSLSGGQPLAGNVLDLMSRNIQSGQTIGIPIGPDTSVVIAEAILTSVDNVLVRKVKSLNQAFRFVDDYEFVCETLPKAEQMQSDLQDALGEFELQLNPRKTRIVELPHVLDTSWVNDLASFRFDSLQGPGLKSGLIRYFSRAFELARDNPGDPVLKYAVRRIAEIKSESFAELIQQLLFQSAVIDPGTLQTALYVAFEHKHRGYQIDLVAMERAISAIIMRHSALQHGGDIAWALWGAVVFGIKLEEQVIQSLESLHDPIAILMSLFADSRGAFRRVITRSQWETLTKDQELFEPSWLVAYEAVGQGWLGNVGSDPANSDLFFAACRRQGVHFMDLNTHLHIPAPSSAGVYA